MEYVNAAQNLEESAKKMDRLMCGKGGRTQYTVEWKETVERKPKMRAKFVGRTDDRNM